MVDIDVEALAYKMNSGGERMDKNRHMNRNKNRNKNSGNNNKGKGRENTAAITAPYNFIPFCEKTIPVEQDQMEVHSDMREDLLTGEISYIMTAQTPVFVDGGTDAHDFVRNAWGKYALPGSTVRGLIRNNVQILGLSGYEDDIDDYSLMYRNVTGGAEKELYDRILGSDQVPITADNKEMSVLLNVRAGYIAKKDGKYVIYSTKVDKISDNLKEMNYYVLSERTIANDLDNFPYFQKHPECLQHDVSQGFTKNEENQYIGVRNQDYQPGYYKVSYRVKGLNKIVTVEEPGILEEKGYLVCTGNMNQKKALYIVPEIDESKPVIVIHEDDEKAFRIDFKKKEKTLKRFKKVSFFDLPEGEEKKPVFYIHNTEDNRLYFGFTPHLRLLYKHTVKEGYRQQTSTFDYAKSIFGTIDGNSGYKSKVSFSDAVASKVVRLGEAAKKVVFAEPKPTSYLDYLKQNDGPVTYNTDGFELRGVKQYWLHKEVIPEFTGKSNAEIRPLAEGTVFKGFIRFQNLTKAELGLLVWGLRLEEDSWMNVGKAKAYGYGAVSVSEVNVKTVNIKKAYDMENPVSSDSFMDPFEPLKEEDIDCLIKVYKREVREKLGSPIDEAESIKKFFIMKNSKHIPDKDKMKYMVLEKYQSRKQPLPEIEQIVPHSE